MSTAQALIYICDLCGAQDSVTGVGENSDVPAGWVSVNVVHDDDSENIVLRHACLHCASQIYHAVIAAASNQTQLQPQSTDE